MTAEQQPISRDFGDDAAERQPGQFARHPKTGAPYVAHPTETSQPTGNKAELIAQCAERGILVPSPATVAVLKQLLGPRPKRVAYGRPSSLGRQIENQTNLQKWSERAVALGIYLDLREQGFLAGLEELRPAQLNLDDAAARELLDAIAVKAKARAQAGLAAERGTHHHELTEDHDTEVDWIERVRHGEDLGVPAHVQAALVQAWAKMLAEFDIEILDTEATVVDDLWRQAGTLDRIVRLRKALRFVLATGESIVLPAGWVGVLDLKTGRLRLDQQGFVAYWHGYAVQCASYAQSVPYDPDTDTRGTWPHPLDQAYAIIAHLDVLAALEGTATCRLFLVDLAAGREAGERCVWARGWEKRTDVFSLAIDQLSVNVPVEGNTIEAATTAVADDPFAQRAAPAPLTQEEAAPSAVLVPPADDPFAMISQQPASPSTFPGEGAPAPESVNGADDLEGAPPAAAANADPFAMPTPEPIRTPGTLPPRPEPPSQVDEGPIIDDAATLLAMSHRFQRLGEGVGIIRTLAADAAKAGYSFSITQLASTRRFEIGRALMSLIEGGCWDDDLVRAVVAHVAGGPAWRIGYGPSLGEAVGALSAAQAAYFAHLADCFGVGTLTIEFDPDGRLALTGPALVTA